MATTLLSPGVPTLGRIPPTEPRPVVAPHGFVRWFRDIGRGDVGTVGGKGANLGEMSRAGLPVPSGFVLPVEAWARFRDASGIGPMIEDILDAVVPDDFERLQRASARLRELVEQAPIPADLASAIEGAYAVLAREHGPAQAPVPPLPVAVRSSATAEDTAQFSFAGMFESFLNVQGSEELLARVKSCWASTFHARVLFYRLKQDMPAEMPVAVVVQAMVGSEKSGVLFTVDPSTRDAGRMVLEAAWGLGEVVVLGQVQPDHYVLDKRTLGVLSRAVGHKDFMLVRDAATGGTVRVELDADPRADAVVLTDAELRAVGELGRRSEAHYGVPQDVEFAIAGGAVYLTQTRPITTLAPRDAAAASVAAPAPPAPAAARETIPSVRGLGASPGVAVGPVRLLASPAEGGRLQPGEVLVTRMTSPDWVPVMRKAVAVVTDAGGMTSHAAIVSRELGIPCVVGTRDATWRLQDGDRVRVDGALGMVTDADDPALAALAAPAAAAGTGADAAAPASTIIALRARLVTATKLYVNLSEPDRAEEVAALDVDGVGLLRAELMMLTALDRTHPRKLLEEKRENEFVSRMATQLRTFARAFGSRPVVYRAMDFRSNEYRGLAGGDAIEPHEDNPMIGYRGCYRYIREPELFALELRALAEVRREHRNLHLMIPFVRTLWELRECKALVERSALAGDRALQLWVMAEVPSVAYWLPEYVKLGVAGVSIGSNDLTQLVLGVDRDSELVAPLFDERDPAVLDTIRRIIRACRTHGITCSICGQAPSVYPDYAERLVRWGIDSVSVNPDVVDQTRRALAGAEQRLVLGDLRRRGDSDC
jgi:pyruvate, water dikinase